MKKNMNNNKNFSNENDRYIGCVYIVSNDRHIGVKNIFFSPSGCAHNILGKVRFFFLLLMLFPLSPRRMSSHCTILNTIRDGLDWQCASSCVPEEHYVRKVLCRTDTRNLYITSCVDVFEYFPKAMGSPCCFRRFWLACHLLCLNFAQLFCAPHNLNGFARMYLLHVNPRHNGYTIYGCVYLWMYRSRAAGIRIVITR